jgi:hypothetical protein
MQRFVGGGAMLEWFAITCSAARLGLEAQNAAAFRLLRAAAGAGKTMPDEIIREEIALIHEDSPVALAPIPEKAIAPKRRPAASNLAHKKSAPVKRGKR